MNIGNRRLGNLRGATLMFAIGYTIGGILIVIQARMQDGTWTSGVAMLGFSLPVTAIYFLILWRSRRSRFFVATTYGTVLAGVLCAIYPAFFGFFPVFFFRFELLIPFVVIQLGLLFLVCAICARLPAP